MSFKSPTRKFWVGGNWKCNPTSLSDVENFVSTINCSKVDTGFTQVVIAPPALFLSHVKQLLHSNFYLASQNCYSEDSGAFTGEISAPMLSSIGVTHVILGHSERRSLFKESNEFITRKIQRCQEHGLHIIACIGEQLQDRDQGKEFDVVFEQLSSIIPVVKDWSTFLIAYEPVWAIGTGRNATPEQAQTMHKTIREFIAERVSKGISECLQIVYGGSVNEKNCESLAIMPDIDGFLVGGASLKPEFSAIIQAGRVKRSQELVE